jgi:anaerobic sulfite reductase subunit C
MVVINVCKGPERSCRNLLIWPDSYREAIERYLIDNRVGPRLRERVPGEKILHHHKLHISISGCPNGCSRPQIVDIGLTGTVKPGVDTGRCTACGSCEEVCPDQAIRVNAAPRSIDRDACLGCTKCRDACPEGCITISEPGARILAGGRLGRKPRFAQPVAVATNPADAVAIIDRLLTDFFEHARPNERFADFTARTAFSLQR